MNLQYLCLRIECEVIKEMIFCPMIKTTHNDWYSYLIGDSPFIDL